MQFVYCLLLSLAASADANKTIRFDLRKHHPNYKKFDEDKYSHLGPNATKFEKV